MTSHLSPRTTTGSDLYRQLAVTLSLIVCVVGSMIGVGVFGGTPIAEAAGGALGSDATLLAPAGAAFSIWSVVYLGLVAYTVWQWLPAQKASPRQRAFGWLVAASMLLNAAWILSIQAGWLNASVLVILVLLAVLTVAFLRYSSRPAASWLEAAIVDGTLGLYLGWVSVAVCANIAAALSAVGFDGLGLNPDLWAVGVLLVVTVVGVGLAVKGNGRLAVAAAIGWGLTWIAVGRTSGQMESSATSITAAVVATIIVLATITIRMRSGRRSEAVPRTA
ncbi:MULTISPECIES: tryptophan-rich sensory protein [unclassified Arthrobacter]|uniref:tryptophan-rich sensory protein n=1 Tax=unclassified Arthrobacter TaxID=235627 RepID=UPI0014919A6F|nr:MULTISPECIES: tryptophan-rich sensory protein [unclassified Arthrobacter]MBE0010526.1 tryptophan-rich sensory protein [Arthrobacter sp. AET 35A]NOJ64335.1 tryptophan-rich sensory protein [Arthrobacter sp. 147(2020)]